MKYTEIAPDERLRPYVKCYYVFESESHVEYDDTVFPVGNMEIIFNLGEGIWKSEINNKFHKTPPVELWGQITKPLAIQSKGKNSMLGIRLLPHTAAYFFDEEVWEFNDQIADLRDLLGDAANTLHARLMDLTEQRKRIDLIESFLLQRLSAQKRKSDKIAMVGKIVDDLKISNSDNPVETVATQYDITPRYLQKLFLQYTGVTPKLYSKINRFQNSLKLIHKKDASLTSIAYECGYFDQSHFIREFKSFTGLTPSSYSPELSPVTQVLTTK